MFVVVVYDVNSKRLSKINKICKKYLHAVQRSVFEGNITQCKLNKLQKELEMHIDYHEDSVCIYEMHSERYVYKEKIGKHEEGGYIL